MICDVEAVIVASLNSSLSPINSLLELRVTFGIDSLSIISKSTDVPEDAACPLSTEEIDSFKFSLPSYTLSSTGLT